MQQLSDARQGQSRAEQLKQQFAGEKRDRLGQAGEGEAQPGEGQSFRAHAQQLQGDREKQRLLVESEQKMRDLLAAKDLPKKEAVTSEIQNIQSQFGTSFNLNTSASRDKLSELLFKPNSFTPTDLGRDKRVRLYLLDIVEEPGAGSSLHLIGRTQNAQGFTTLRIRVRGAQRELYVIPRRGCTAAQVLAEFRQLLSARKMSAEQLAAVTFSVVQRRYCFEYAVDLRDDEGDVLRVNYPFAAPFLAGLPITGQSYNGIIGQNYTSLELFQLRHRVQGPGWFVVEGVGFDGREFVAEDALGLLAAVETKQGPPPLTVASVQVRLDDRGKEVAALHLTVWAEHCVDTGAIGKTDQVHYARARPEAGEESGYNEKQTFFAFENECSLLSDFCILFSKVDPDVVIGHDLFAGSLDVLLYRLETKFSDPSAMLARAPSRKLRGGSLATQVRALFAGRLIADLYGFVRETEKMEDYSLAALAARFGSAQAKPLYTASPRETANALIRVCRAVQLLPLTLQLSRVGGCLWSVSLRQARSERNEMLLMHTFWQRGYIVPERPRRSREGDAEAEERKTFSGGKVLEPVPGLYNTYVVLVDFNSLYPSIIRYFRICFTTVRRDFYSFRNETIAEAERPAATGTAAAGATTDLELGPGDEEDEIKDPLAEIDAEGGKSPLLPEILTFLVSKRREVKGLIKSAKSEAEAAQLDVRQKAYKLIANSIYGCLGFQQSRFYARKMALLVTTFGRRLLLQTKRFIEEKGHRVLYGDTDSIMVDTTKLDVLEAIRCGYQLKKDINAQYRPKGNEKQILEVELDGLFKKLLLLKKKKYAALTVRNFAEIATGRAREEALHLEAKGLDLVRRDWPGLTKRVSQRVLDLLFETGDMSDVMGYLQQVSEALERVNAQLQAKYVSGAEPAGLEFGLKDFVIRKQLNKKPSEYKEASSLPQLRVAQWLLENGHGEEQLVNHFIPYVVVEGPGGVAERAVHPDLFAAHCAAGSPPALDIAWYKTTQLLAPIERFVDAVDACSRDTLQSMLGSGKQAEQPGPSAEPGGLLARAKGALNIFYAEGQEVNTDWLQLPCPHCGQPCPGYAPHCSCAEQTPFAPAVVHNRFALMLARVMRELSREAFDCGKCRLGFEDVLVERCYKCGGELAARTATKSRYAALFFVNALVQASLGHTRQHAPLLQTLQSVLNRTYESNILDAFRVYSAHFPPRSGNLFQSR